MLTQRRLAQIGLVAALSIIVGSMVVLLAQDTRPTTSPADHSAAAPASVQPTPDASHAQLKSARPTA